LNAAVFGTLSLAFTFALFEVAVALRRKFWVPVPVSIKLAGTMYRPVKSSFRLPGVGSVESAILLKDFRSLVRRREMARFLAIPFVLAVSMSLSMFPMRNETFPAGLFAQLFIYIFPLIIFSQLLAMTSIGQEGRAIWNLYAAPVKAESVLQAKFLLAIILGSAFCVAMILVLGAVFGLAANLPLLLFVGIGIVLEQAAIGMVFAGRFPDFRETVRSRYVSVWGSLIGMAGGFLVGFVTLAPLLAQFILGFSLLYGAILSFAIAISVSVVFLRAARGQLRELFRNITV
jgi:hypothetical protein